LEETENQFVIEGVFPFQFQLIARSHGVYLIPLTFNIFFSIIHGCSHDTLQFRKMVLDGTYQVCSN